MKNIVIFQNRAASLACYSQENEKKRESHSMEFAVNDTVKIHNRAASLAGYSQENEKKRESFDLHAIAISMDTVFDPNWSLDVKTSCSIEFNAGEAIEKNA